MRTLLLFCLLVVSTYCDDSTPLCPLPPFAGGDDVHIACQAASGSTSTPTPQPPANLSVAAYNIDRNGYGGDGSREAGLQPIIDMFTQGVAANGTTAGLPARPDVLLLSEASRGCASYGNYMNGPAQIAQALGMHWAYAVEFVVVSQSNATSECSIGNAILSKFPLTAVTQTRFESQCCRFGDRYGGRVAVSAVAQISSEVSLTLSSMHLESGQDAKDTPKAEVVRARQAYQIAKNLSGSPAVAGGDLNSPLGDVLSPAVEAFELHGWSDAHKSLPRKERVTDPDDPLSKHGLGCFDYLFARASNGAKNGFVAPNVCHAEGCAGYSDHVPIYATLVL